MGKGYFEQINALASSPTRERQECFPPKRSLFRQLTHGTPRNPCIYGDCDLPRWYRPVNCVGESDGFDIGETLHWTESIVGTRRRFSTSITGDGTAKTVLAFPLRFDQVNPLFTSEGQLVTTRPLTLLGSSYPAWSGKPILGQPLGCYTSGNYNFALNSVSGTNGLYAATRKDGTREDHTAITMVLGTFSKSVSLLSPSVVYGVDIVFGTTFTAGQTDTRTFIIQSRANYHDDFGSIAPRSTSVQNFVPWSGVTGSQYSGYELTWSGGSWRPTGSVGDVFAMKNKLYAGAAASCGYYEPGAANFTEMNMNTQLEIPVLEVNISGTVYRYAPEPDGSYVQEVEGALSGTLYKHTVGKWDCKTLKNFLPYYGIEINNPPRTWPFTMPTSVTIERKLYTG